MGRDFSRVLRNIRAKHQKQMVYTKPNHEILHEGVFRGWVWCSSLLVFMFIFVTVSDIDCKWVKQVTIALGLEGIKSLGV